VEYLAALAANRQHHSAPIEFELQPTLLRRLITALLNDHGYAVPADHFASSAWTTSGFRSSISMQWKAFLPASLSDEPTSQQRSLKTRWRSWSMGTRLTSM